jgi:predicted dehydrogenase
MRVSQIATAEENNLRLSVYGRRGALKWAQEEPNRLEFLQEGKPRAILTPGHAYNLPASRDATKLPPGHPEGLIDAMGNLYRGVARAINDQSGDPGDYPGIDEGVRGMRFIEAVLKSAGDGNVWVSL